MNRYVDMIVLWPLLNIITIFTLYYFSIFWTLNFHSRIHTKNIKKSFLKKRGECWNTWIEKKTLHCIFVLFHVSANHLSPLISVFHLTSDSFIQFLICFGGKYIEKYNILFRNNLCEKCFDSFCIIFCYVEFFQEFGFVFSKTIENKNLTKYHETN